jgi:hypothetical protein
LNTSGHVGSLYRPLITSSVDKEAGNVVFGDPALVPHGTLDRIHLIDYKIPGLDIGLDALAEIVESLTGWRLHKVTVDLNCTGGCEARTWRALLHFGSNQTFQVSGTDFPRYVDQGADLMFLQRYGATPDSVNPVDFFAFVSFEAKQYTDPCTRNMLLLGFAPEAILAREWRMMDPVGPYIGTECEFLIGAINQVNSGKYQQVIHDYELGILSQHETDGLQYAMVLAFAQFKVGDKEMATSDAHWIDDQICKPNVPDTNGEGSLHRYILGKWGTTCPLSKAYPRTD